MGVFRNVGARLDLGVVLLLALALSGAQPAYPAEGIFRGRVVPPPDSDSLPRGWILVQGNRATRRVEVGHAVIVCPPPSAASQARRCGPESLQAGQEVVVTARQDASGEWRATRVEILGVARLPAELKPSAG